MSELLNLSLIRLDGGTQPRSSVFMDVVEEYIDAMMNGAVFPPVTVFFDGTSYWLADGFHRCSAYLGMKLDAVECDVRQGSQRDAILFSVGANSAHGLKRTNEDKRRAVNRLLSDPEWSHWSDREISRHCRVSHEFVRKIRPVESVTVNVDSEPTSRTYTTKHGTVATMATANIGRPAEMPNFAAPSPHAPAQRPEVAAFAKDMEANAFIHHIVREIIDQARDLPSPLEAAHRYPALLRHAFNPADAIAVADWYAAFASAWTLENGDAHVAAE